MHIHTHTRGVGRAAGCLAAALALGLAGPAAASDPFQIRVGGQSFLVEDKAIVGLTFGLGVSAFQLDVAWNLGWATSDEGKDTLRGDSFFGSVIDLHAGVQVFSVPGLSIRLQTGCDIWWLSSIHEEETKLAMPAVLTGEVGLIGALVARVQARYYLLRSAGLMPGRSYSGEQGQPIILTLGLGGSWP